jgi:hypothetical protein
VFGTSYAIGAPGRDHPRLRDEQAEPLDDNLEAEAGDDATRGDPRHARVTVVATGPGGAAWSPDEGDSWLPLDGVANYWAAAFADERTGWLVGTAGRILRIDF